MAGVNKRGYGLLPFPDGAGEKIVSARPAAKKHAKPANAKNLFIFINLAN
jgi:hypothetical protein